MHYFVSKNCGFKRYFVLNIDILFANIMVVNDILFVNIVVVSDFSNIVVVSDFVC